jgi:hypothetical protein
MATTVPEFVRGAALLGVDGFTAVTRVVEAMHADIAGGQMPWDPARSPRTRGITGFVYRTIGAVGHGVRHCIDLGLRPFARSGTAIDGAGNAAFVAALNGVFGDHLEATGNPLAQAMRLRCQGRDLVLGREALREAVAVPGERVAILVHGLCMNDRQWQRAGASHADALRDQGFTVLHLVYNSGRHISANGRAFSTLLARLVDAWPVPLDGLVVLAHSMGGLVARSACHYGAGSAWRARLRRLVFLGTPHHGASLERGGHRFERFAGRIPFAAALAGLGSARSAGITDLRHGNLLDEDWLGGDRFDDPHDRRRIVPLPHDVDCLAIAGEVRALGSDGLVGIASALGEHPDPERDLAIPADRKQVIGGSDHFDLLHDRVLQERIARWLAAG